MEQLGKKAIAQQTITSQVVENLRRDILSKQIPAGSHIGVKEIAERYGVSNMPVREAFFTLAAEKLIEMSPYKGAEVLPINRQFIADIYEIQGMLDKYHDEGKEPGFIAQSMSRMKTNFKLGTDESDETVADLMTDGCNMGVKSLNRYLNQYKAASEVTKDITKRLINLEEKLAIDIRQYL